MISKDNPANSETGAEGGVALGDTVGKFDQMGWTGTDFLSGTNFTSSNGSSN